jgi:hypothetical protein
VRSAAPSRRKYGQAIGTALGMVPAFKQQGLGYMDPDLVAASAKSVETYMGVKNLPPLPSWPDLFRPSTS